MKVAVQSNSIPLDSDGVELIEALHAFFRSRATKALIRHGEDREVRCDLRVPLFKSCKVDAALTGRALRKLWRKSMDEGTPGDRVIIDLAIDADFRLVFTVSDYRDAVLPDDPAR